MIKSVTYKWTKEAFQPHSDDFKTLKEYIRKTKRNYKTSEDLTALD